MSQGHPLTDHLARGGPKGTVSLVSPLQKPLCPLSDCVRRTRSVHGQGDLGPHSAASSKSFFAISAQAGALAGSGVDLPGTALLYEYFPSPSCGPRRDLMFRGPEEEKTASVPIAQLPGSERLIGYGPTTPGWLCPGRGSCVCWHSQGRLPGGGVQVDVHG